MKENLILTGNGGGGGDPYVNLVADVTPVTVTFWKDKLFGRRSTKSMDIDVMESDDFIFSKGIY